MRHLDGGRASQPEKQAASASEVGRFETEILARIARLALPPPVAGRDS
jgi:hypothetical protein